jgi:hypothetical protein
MASNMLAKPPCICGVFEAEPMKKMFSHRLSRPSRHGVQRPHQRDGLTATRSPDFRPGAEPAISMTSPAISWPSTSGEVTTKSPVRAWR